MQRSNTILQQNEFLIEQNKIRYAYILLNEIVLDIRKQVCSEALQSQMLSVIASVRKAVILTRGDMACKVPMKYSSRTEFSRIMTLAAVGNGAFNEAVRLAEVLTGDGLCPK